MPNAMKNKQTMLEKAIPEKTIAQFDFPYFKRESAGVGHCGHQSNG